MTISTRTSRPHITRRPLALALALALASPAALAQSTNQLPTGPTGLVGLAPGDIVTVGNTMTIRQAGRGGVINWETFSIGSGATVDFNHALAGSVTLNRVLGIDGAIEPSRIAGALNAPNGHVFIINPRGVVFGGTARVNVGGLVASTLALDDDAFAAGLANGDRFAFSSEGATGGDIEVQANAVLRAADGGTLALIGTDSVINRGSMIADGGSVILGQGQRITLDYGGDGLTQMVLESQDNVDNRTLRLLNAGLLQADGGQVVMASRSGSGTSGDFAVVQQGEMRARSLVSRAGRIVLSGAESRVEVRGLIDATGSAALVGGDIAIDGGTVDMPGAVLPPLAAGPPAVTRIDASGGAGGGTVRIHSRETTRITGTPEFGVDYGFVIRADALQTGNGGLVELTSEGLRLGIDLAGAVSVSANGAANGVGGTVRMRTAQGDLLLENADAGALPGTIDISADGGVGGGFIDLQGRNRLQVSPGASLHADALFSGTGGTVRTASSDLLDLRGVNVSTGGPGGGGRWSIESGRGLAIVGGDDTDWSPELFSLVDDAALSATLSAGGNVAIVVAQPEQGTAQINIAPGVDIDHAGSARARLSLQALGGQIIGGVTPEGAIGTWRIGSSGGAPLDITMDAASSLGLYSGALSSAGGDITLRSRASSTGGVEIEDTQVDSAGGDVVIDGGTAADTAVRLARSQVWTGGGALSIAGISSGASGVVLEASDLDSRTGRSDLGAGGTVSVTGAGAGPAGAGVSLSGTTVQSSSGAIALSGQFAGAGGAQATGLLLDRSTVASTSGAIALSGRTSGGGAGVVLDGRPGVTGAPGGAPARVASGSGSISISGLGSAGAGAAGDGILSQGYALSSGSGDIRLIGRGDGTAASGIRLGAGSDVSAQTGDVALDGYATGTGAGILVGGVDGLLAAARVRAGGDIVLRAGNGGNEALRVAGTVAAQGMVNLRTGQVDADGVASDDVAAALRIGGAGAHVSTASLANIATPDLVIGHAGHAGTITVADAIVRSGNLTLHNTGGAGGIVLDAAVDVGAGTLALASGGDIRQSQAGTVVAGALLARSTGGGVDLATADNTVGTLAGDAADAFAFRNTGALTVGNVGATGADAAGSPVAIAASGARAGEALLVRTLAGDLALAADVAGGDVDLVTAGRLQNTGASITATNRWRVWADTWVGETRGGLTGSGSLPNLFNCSFGGPCGVDAAVAGNHFIYRQQPLLRLVIGNATREYGLDNPAFGFGVDGLVFGDDLAANVVQGAPGTAATMGSNVGVYAIDGQFSSAAGYALQVTPGALAITPATLVYIADPLTLFYGQSAAFTGRVAGFRNGDTLSDLDGDLLFSSTGSGLFPGVHAIVGSGLASGNYVFAQAPSNFTALQVVTVPPPALPSLVRLPPETWLYSSNVGQVAMCAATGPMDGTRLDAGGDALGREWSRVRSRPNLTSCVATDRRNGCSDF